MNRIISMKSSKLRPVFAICIFCLISTFISAQTLTLDSCIALARKNNADIRTSQLEIKRAQEVKKQAFTKFFPQVRLSALGYKAAEPIISFGISDVKSQDMQDLLESIYETFSTETDINDRVEAMEHGLSGSVSVVQPIFAGGRIINGNKLASIGEQAAELQSEIKVRDVVENIESSYYLVTGLAEKVATVNAALSLIDSLDKVVASALGNGLVTRADALQVELKRNEINAMSHKLVSGIRLSKRLLCTQIGVEYSDDIVFLPEDTLEPPLVDFAYGNRGDSLRPESKLLNLNIQAEELKKKMTIGESLPQIVIAGLGYYGDMTRDVYSGNIIGIFSLNIPISGWWEASRKIQQHNVKIEQARIMQDNLSSMMSLEEEKTYSDMIDAWMLIKSDSSALDVARENYRLAQLNYTAGTITISDVLQAHALLLQAQNALTDRRVEYITARRRLSDLLVSTSER